MGDFFMRRCPTFRLPPWQGSRAKGSKGPLRQDSHDSSTHRGRR
ncbi:hypothetical protein SynPROS91_01603 [Synechococcus sp. PROS-9-1]|nr:hypothetical protein SynPROS91_01603 [Synechococcus sp. PROS-9-1]